MEFIPKGLPGFVIYMYVSDSLNRKALQFQLQIDRANNEPAGFCQGLKNV